MRLLIMIFSSLFFCESSFCYALSARDRMNPVILTNEGWSFLNSKNFNTAEDYFKKALSLDPHNADANAGMASVIYLRGAKGSFYEHNKDTCQKAWDFIEKAPLRSGGSDRVHFVKSEILLCLGDFQGALREIGQIDAGCVGHLVKSRAFRQKAGITKASADAQMAILEGTDYLECIQHVAPDGDALNGYKNLYEQLTKEKDFDATVQYFKKRIEDEPYSQWSYRNYIWVLHQRNMDGDMDEAERTVNKAKKVMGLELGMDRILYDRGDKYLTKKKYAEALKDFVRLLAINPYHRVAVGKIEEICSESNDRRCPKIWQDLIREYVNRGDCESAVKEFQRQYSVNPAAFEPLKDIVSRCQGKKK